MNATGPALRLAGVVKDYALDWRGRRQRALDGVSFVVAPGSVCALVGANGSGKSTTLKLCADLVRATAGHCEVAGLPPAAAVRAGRLAYLPEETLAPAFGDAEEFLLRLAGIAGVGDPRAAVDRALEQAGLREAAARPVAALSKGQRQRLGLAQALLRDPAVLLLDEPASGLDPRGLAELRDILRSQREAGRAVLYTTHALAGLEELCDRIVVLARGRVVFDGDAATVAARGGLERIYLEEVKG